MVYKIEYLNAIKIGEIRFMNKHKEENQKIITEQKEISDSTVQEEQLDYGIEAKTEEQLQENVQEDSTAKKIAELENNVLKLVEKLAISEDKYLRLNAEFDNFRKRSLRERNDVRVSTQFEVLTSIIPVLDHFEFAMSSAEQSHNLEKLFEGMELIKTEFEKALASQGVELINAVGQPFDPRFHEAVAHEDSDEYEKDIVSKQWRLGYKIGDRVIRPATVVISNGKKQPEGSDK